MFFHNRHKPESKIPKSPSLFLERESSKPVTLEELFRFEGAPDATVTIGGRSYIYFAGEGYLGLQTHPEVLATACEAVLQYGLSSAATRRQFTPSPVIDVEKLAAHLFGTDSAFYCPSEDKLIEFVFEAMIGSYDRIFIDEGCHSLLSRAVRRDTRGENIPITFRHQDAGHLAQLLKKETAAKRRPLVVTEGVFASTGAIAPLNQYKEILATCHEGGIFIDDSHGFGVLGKSGRGTPEHFGWNPSDINRTRSDLVTDELFTESYSDSSSLRVFWMASLAKAFGGFGTLLPGSDLFVQRISELAIRSGTGAPPAPVAAATCKSLELSFTDSAIRKKLLRNTQYLKKGLRQLGFLVEDTPVPIISLSPGTSSNMRRIQQILSEKQFLISYFPRQKNSGSQGTLRMTVVANHSRPMLAAFLKALAEAVV